MDDDLEDFLAQYMPEPVVAPQEDDDEEEPPEGEEDPLDFFAEAQARPEPAPPTVQEVFDKLRLAVAEFVNTKATHEEPTLFGVTDGKAVGTFLEQRFRAFVQDAGNSAKGLDLPTLNVDIKATSARQPQSSCPFHSSRQKVFGLGYSLLIFVYDKVDNPKQRTASLTILNALLVEAHATGDFNTTKAVRELIAQGATKEDLVKFLVESDFLVGGLREAEEIAQDALRSPPAQGYLTISNALQWRLQYKRTLRSANAVSGVFDLREPPT